jgi:hypothetical protein
MARNRHYRYRKLEFWAERGMINLIDERYPQSSDKFFTVIMVREFLLRLDQLNKEVKRWGKQWTDERQEMIKLIEEGITCCRQAKAQGRPDDPKAVADMLKVRQKSMLLAGNSGQSYKGAILASHAPEGVLLPPLPTPGISPLSSPLAGSTVTSPTPPKSPAPSHVLVV